MNLDCCSNLALLTLFLLMVTLPKNCAVMKFQLLKNYPDILRSVVKNCLWLLPNSKGLRDNGVLFWIHYFGIQICWKTPPCCHSSIYHAHIWILGNNNVVLLFFIWPPEAFWSYFCCRSTNCVATGSNHIWMCIQYTSNYFLFPRLVLIFNLLQYESYIKFTHHYKQ